MGNTKVYVFVFTTTTGGETREDEYQFPAHSKQMAWIAAASYVACHIMNPPVDSIRFVQEMEVVNTETVSKLVAHPNW